MVVVNRTLLNCIAGLLKPKSGQILLDNCKIKRNEQQTNCSKKLLMSRSTAHKTYQYRVRDYVVLGRATHLGVFDKPSEADLH